jgi:hypothetical protein
MQPEEALMQNIKEYMRNALDAKSKGEHNTAVTLFFKAMIGICDLHLFRKEGFLPSSHTHRFRVLEAKYGEIYRIIDKNFSLYQDSYKLRMDFTSSGIMEKDVRRLSKITGIQV